MFWLRDSFSASAFTKLYNVEMTLSVLVGLAVVLVIAVEMVATITMTGGGPVAMGVTWCASRFVRRNGGLKRPLPQLGMITILCTVTGWFLVLWLGWLIVFTSSPQAVLEGSTGNPAPFWSRVYFSGYTLSTLGIGDYQPGTQFYQVLTAFASLSSFFLITLIISFFVPMVQGEMQRRRLALYIHHLGDTPERLLKRVWREEDKTVPILSTLSPMLVTLEHTHRRYPALHFSGAKEPAYALVLAVAMLDEVLTILETTDNVQQDEHFLVSRRAVAGFVSSLEEVFVAFTHETPPLPDLSLIDNSADNRSEEVKERLESYAERRARLHTMLRCAGWTWAHVSKENREPAPVRMMFGE